MLQKYFESLQGQIVIVAIIAGLLLLITILSKKEEKLNIKALTYSSIAIVLAYVLNQITIIKMPQGGSVTPFSLLFIVLIGYLFGIRQGILAGIAFGLLDLMINPYVVHPIQMLLDYPLAFGALGLGAVFRNKNLILVYVAGVAGRFLCHFISGVIFFGMYAPEGMSGITYSFIYNISFLGVEAVLTCVLLLLPPIKNALLAVEKNI
ncbi:MAG: energy-coupled thiamine transporter ThiT [Eubacteriaceae bacterium]